MVSGQDKSHNEQMQQINNTNNITQRFLWEMLKVKVKVKVKQRSSRMDKCEREDAVLGTQIS